ncbi:hypothetical protein [Streptomyces tanashiensis]|uniref:hypothetical protein n=1 Tax=Streptomyces tanashiensis TaxID=67367 RepID=UPI0033C1374F
MNTKSIRTRDALMKLFAVAETVTASLEEPPTSVNIMTTLGDPHHVSMSFHCSPEHVLAAAKQYDAEPVVVENYAGNPNGVCTETTIQHDGVTVRFWALVHTAAEEVSA